MKAYYKVLGNYTIGKLTVAYFTVTALVAKKQETHIWNHIQTWKINSYASQNCNHMLLSNKDLILERHTFYNIQNYEKFTTTGYK